MGVTPNEWRITSIGDLQPFVTSGSRGWAEFYSEHGSLFVRITNMSRDSIYLDLREPKFVNLPAVSSEGTRTQLQEHDVLISITADIGIISYVDSRVPLPAYINQHIALVRFDQSKTCGKFVAYFLSAQRAQKLFRASTDTGAKAGMSLPGVQKIEIRLPSLPEQRAISEALSDVDALLDGLERLMAKKRDLKQAAMQQLLTGRSRLAAFDQPWETKALGTLCSMKSGVAITGDAIDSFSPYRCYGGNGLRGYASRFTHDGAFALIGRQGALCGNVIGVEGKFFASEHAVVVAANSNVDIKWLTYMLSRMKLNQYSESSAQPGLSVSKILMLEVAVPPSRDEQAAIAEVLSDMDAEVEALEQRRDKTRLLKQGMMQELLTGRTRLV
jgi:type I restriction enzyme S subunit